MAGKRAVKIGMMLAVLMLGIAAIGMAQEADPMNFTYGKISKITGNEIGVMVYDFNVHDEVEEAYVVDAQTVFDGVESVTGLSVGDDIDIEYVEADGAKVIKNLYKTVVDVGGTAAVETDIAEDVQEGEAVEMNQVVGEAADVQALEAGEEIQEGEGAEEIQNLDETDMLQDLEEDEMIQNAEDIQSLEGMKDVQGAPASEQADGMYGSEL